MKIFVRPFSGKTTRINAGPHDSVLAVKGDTKDKEGVQTRQQSISRCCERAWNSAFAACSTVTAVCVGSSTNLFVLDFSC